MQTTSLASWRVVAAASVLTTLAATTQADMADPQGAAARFESERAACLSGQTPQSRDTCLQEARAAYAQARRGGAQPADAAQYDANRVARCEPLPADQRRDCVARMSGAGSTSGSVSEGGILRELVTIVPADAPVAR